MRKILIGAAVLLLAGCSKLNIENYEKLEAGMSQAEVEAIIGSADNCSKTLGTLACIWGDEKATHIKIGFIGDKAVTFSYEGLE
ncbi:DUF3862 domain-containing protein [Alteromonas sp. CYL-A6]|uniref:DUF3862 domain-containing protein n=1 Tax=Alteromonas nitratireducens TaxID=3390813 RepID=UPI0034B428E2